MKSKILSPVAVREADPTKVEVSFRDRYEGDESVVDVPNGRFFSDYGLEPGPIRRYRRDAAVRQKIDALAGRREAQARDVFDLSILVKDTRDEALLAFLASGLTDKTLDGALDRVFTITLDEYEGRVLEFLDDAARRRCGTEDAWADIQLQVATLIEAVLARQGDT